MGDGRTGGHQAQLTRPNHVVVTQAVTVVHRAGEQPADRLQAHVRMRRHGHARAISDVLGAVVVGEIPRADQPPAQGRQQPAHRGPGDQGHLPAGMHLVHRPRRDVEEAAAVAEPGRPVQVAHTVDPTTRSGAGSPTRTAVAMNTTVTDNARESRYEIRFDGARAGFAEYHLHAGVVAFLHTQISPQFGRRGLASELIRAALDSARYPRPAGATVLPVRPRVHRQAPRLPRPGAERRMGTLRDSAEPIESGGSCFREVECTLPDLRVPARLLQLGRGLVEQPARDDQQLDLLGALEDVEDLRVARPLLQQLGLAVAERAGQLDAAQRDRRRPTRPALALAIDACSEFGLPLSAIQAACSVSR